MHEFNIKNGFISNSDSEINGSLLVSSGITAETFSVPNGTSSQFLMADGSSSTGITDNSKLDFSFAGNGIISGMTLSINIDNTKFNISIGLIYCLINGNQHYFQYSGSTGITIIDFSANASYIAYDHNTDTVIQQNVPFTPSQRRTYVILGTIVHSNHVIINVINNLPDVFPNILGQYNDLLDALKPINVSGNEITPNPSKNLKINKNSGVIFKRGVGFNLNQNNPHQVNLSSLTAPTNIRFRTQTGTETSDTDTIDCGFYDLNGVRTALTSGFQIMRIALFPSNIIRIQYGQTKYASMSDALAGINTESFNVEQNIADNGLFRCALIVRWNTDDLKNINQAKFINLNKFGEISQSVGGIGGTTDLQQAYNNSAEPEITTNSILGALTFKRGSSGDTDNVIEILDGNSVIRTKITGDGKITANSFITSGGTVQQFVKGNGTLDSNSYLTVSGASSQYQPIWNTVSIVNNDLNPALPNIDYIFTCSNNSYTCYLPDIIPETYNEYRIILKNSTHNLTITTISGSNLIGTDASAQVITNVSGSLYLKSDGNSTYNIISDIRSMGDIISIYDNTNLTISGLQNMAIYNCLPVNTGVINIILPEPRTFSDFKSVSSKFVLGQSGAVAISTLNNTTLIGNDTTQIINNTGDLLTIIEYQGKYIITEDTRKKVNNVSLSTYPLVEYSTTLDPLTGGFFRQRCTNISDTRFDIINSTILSGYVPVDPTSPYVPISASITDFGLFEGFMPSGSILSEIYGASTESGITAYIVYSKFDDNNVETEICRSNIVSLDDPTIRLYYLYSTYPDFTMNSSDRLVARVWARRLTNSGGVPFISYRVEGPVPTTSNLIEVPISSLSHNVLVGRNNLNAHIDTSIYTKYSYPTVGTVSGNTQSDFNSGVEYRLLNNYNLLTGETENRITGDTVLNNLITGETTNRISGDTVLNNLITGETFNRITGDTVLNNLITGETSIRISQDIILNNLITGETANRISQDIILNNSITGLTSNVTDNYNLLTGETVNRISGDTVLNNSITGLTSTVTSNYNLLTGETANRISGDTVLNNSITGLTLTVTSNYNLLTGETVNRISGDIVLSNSITGLTSTVTNNYNLLTGETTNRISDDIILNNLITGETASRISSDTVLNNSITGLTSTVTDNYNLLTGETANRISGDTVLNNLITGETSNRISGDTNLFNLLTGETANRISGDTALNNIITGLTAASDINILITDNTTNNATINKHGFLPKLSNDIFQYLSGDGTWTTPSNGYAGLLAQPTFTDNGNGTITLGPTDCMLYSTTDFTGNVKKYTLSGATLTPTDKVASVICANYNGGNPIYTIEIQGTVNWSNVSAISTIYRDGVYFDFLSWDDLSNGLSEKTYLRFLKTQRFAWESGLGISESATRIINIGSGKAWNGVVRNDLPASVSNVNSCNLFSHSGGIWIETSITQYNNTQYDNGTNLVTVADGHYVVNWIYRQLSSTDNEMIVVLNSTDCVDEASALASQPPNVPTVVSTHAFLVGKIIVLKNASTASNIQSAFSITFTSSPVTNHSSLSNLDYGNSGHIGFLASNNPITGATKTKITYDSNGLVTSGDNATTADIVDSLDKRYITDVKLAVLNNTSGTNSGDNAVNALYSGFTTSKQDILVSNTNIKTVNLTSLLGSGDIAVATATQGTKADNALPITSFTDSSVTSKLLTGLNISGGSILASDTILTAFGKLQNVVSGLLGGSIFQSVWNATTNAPTLTSSSGTKGYYYIVSVSGTTSLNGISDWQIGDWAIYDGTVWRKVDNTDAVSSVNGYTGAISLTTANIPTSTDKNYVTNAGLTVLGNTSNTNTGDETISTIKTKLGITTLSGSNTGDNATNSLYSGFTTSKQDTLVSNNNIKTVNLTSLLGSGDISVATSAQGTLADNAVPNTRTVNSKQLNTNIVLGTADIADSLDKRYVTDAKLTVLTNTSGTNSGDNAVNSLYSGLTTNATHTGDATGNTALRVVGINNVIMSTLGTGLVKNTTTTGVPSIASSGSDYVAPGSIVGDGLTMNTNKILGRTTASAGALEEISVGTGLSLSAGVLTTTGGSATITTQDEGITQSSTVNTLNFVGAGVTASGAGNVTTVTIPTVIPAGSDKSIQFNDGGTTFGGVQTFTYDKTSNSLYLGGTTAGLILSGITSEPSAASAGTLRMYSKPIANRLVAKVIGPSGIDTPLQNAIWQNNLTYWNPSSVTNGLWIGTVGTGAGTFSAGLPTVTSLYTTMKRARYANIVTTTNQVLGQRNTENMFFAGSAVGQGGFFFTTTMGFDTWTNGGRFFAGMHTATTVVSADPSASLNTVGFCVNAADNGLIYFMTSNASTATRVSTGFTIVSGKGYELFIFVAPGTSTYGWRIIDINAGTENSGTATLTTPVANTMLTTGVLASNAALTPVTSINLGINKIYVETDR